MEGDRIEIELVPNEAGGRRPTSAIAERQTPADHSGVGADRTLEAESPDSGIDRFSEPVRTITIAAAVGLVALVLGWAAGRSGGADDATSTSVARPDTSAEIAIPPTNMTDRDDEPVDTIAPLDEPSPLVSWPPVARQRNATDLVSAGAAIETESVRIDPRLAGSSLRLVAQRGGDLAELDLADGTLTSYVLDGLPRDYGGTIVPGESWVLIPMFEGLAFVVYDDGRVERSDVNPGGSQVLHVAGTDRFWRIPSVTNGGQIELEEVDVRGEPTGGTIELPTSYWPAFGDPRGGVVVQASGRWFGVGPEGSSAIGVGEVVALDTSTAVLYECVALDDCGLWRADRDTGDRVEVPTEVDGVSPRYLPAAWWSSDAGVGLSPDGMWLAAMVEHDAGRHDFVVVDLLTGTFVELGPSRPGPPTAVWTSGGRFLVYLDGIGAPTAYSPETGESFPVVVDGDVIGWNTLSARP